jgi:hypothetical protein
MQTYKIKGEFELYESANNEEEAIEQAITRIFNQSLMEGEVFKKTASKINKK